MIGTGGHGHTFPGATLPFGFCQLSPDTRIDGSWDGCSGYHFSDSIIYGFSHTHLSGTGCSDYGDILLMPTSASVSMKNYDYASSFTHKNEKASAGFYEVLLDQGQIKVELTSTLHCGIHRYTFPTSAPQQIVLDLKHRDEVLSSHLEVLDDSTVRGYRFSKAWANNQKIYFYLRFSRPFTEVTYAQDVKAVSPTAPVFFDKQQHALFQFGKSLQPLMVKVGISGVDEEGAQKNLETEAQSWYFEQYKSMASDAWDKELSKIKVYGQDETDKKVFYTALYHSMISPNIFNDVDGRYRGRDDKIHSTEGKFNYYTVFSLWDTYRGLHPLLTLIDKQRTLDFIQTFLKQYQQGGRLPIWELSSNETNCMIGYHAVSVMLDAYVKGIRGFDAELALKAMKSAAKTDLFGINQFHEHGYLSIEDESESVSKTLEYAYNDWCIAEMSRLLKHEEDAAYYNKYAQAWKHVIDNKTGFARPRSNGGWLSPFDPYQVNNHYTEANSWQYSFAMPQHIQSYQQDQNLQQKLDELFRAKSSTSGREQADITGLIGQYAHGNEPSHHILYLYNQIQPYEKTNVNKLSGIKNMIMHEFYRNQPDGLIGNEDCGQMSAWYVLSAMGIYPVCPGKDRFEISQPLFDSVVIQQDKPFTIIGGAKNIDEEMAVYLQQEQTWQEVNHISQASMAQGGKLLFTNEVKPNALPLIIEQVSTEEVDDNSIPTFLHNEFVFDESMKISFDSISTANLQIRYTTNGTVPDAQSTLYTQPFDIRQSAEIHARYQNKQTLNMHPFESKAHFVKRPNHYKIKLASTYNPQYTAGGDAGLLDGLYGDIDWRKGRWQGFQAQDFEAEIDLGKILAVNFVAANFLQDQKSWIFYPTQIEFYGSSDRKKWTLISSQSMNKLGRDDERNTLTKISTKTKLQARYIRVKAKNFGKIPAWHPGAGGDAFIFIDEIEIN